MKCYRYAVEGYEDFIHQMGHFKQYKIYIPSPYNFSVVTWHDKIHYIKRQDKIDDFKNDHFGFNPKIHEIEIDKKTIEKLYDSLLKEEKMLEERKALTNIVLEYKSEEEILEKIFKEGSELIKSKEYSKAITNFEKCINGKFSTKESYYNISCCYSLLKMKNDSIKYLKLAIDNGYKNWFHIVEDTDLSFIKDEPEIVEIIKALLKINPKKQYSSCTYLDKNGRDSGDKYLEKHNLDDYYYDYTDYYNKANSKRFDKCYSEAIKLYNKVIEHNELRKSEYYYPAICYAELDDKENALKCLKIALEGGLNIKNVFNDKCFDKYKDEINEYYDKIIKK